MRRSFLDKRIQVARIARIAGALVSRLTVSFIGLISLFFIFS